MRKYIRYVIENMEPIRIGNDQTSQQGQTDTLDYIPGSTIRGVVLNVFSKKDGFDDYKPVLLSNHIHFMNAYLIVDGWTLIPSPKGLYENKAETELKNVLAGEDVAGYKRASVGRYCYIKDGCIYYTDTELSEDLNIRTGSNDKAVFRSQYMKKNQKFAGYITFDETVADGIINQIKDILRPKSRLNIGNRRSTRYGTCSIVEEQYNPKKMPYEDIREVKDADNFYIILLSATVMRSETGEYVGLYLPEIARLLECDSLKIEACATSICEVHGYNRMWGGSIPSAIMYEGGSVFHIQASSIVSAEKLRALEEEGIGVRRNEGFGQIAILEDCVNVKNKQKLNKEQYIFQPLELLENGTVTSVENDLRIAARGLLQNRIVKATERYLIGHPLELNNVQKSKLGMVESICLELRCEPEQTAVQLKQFAAHLREKDDRWKIHNDRPRQDALYQYIYSILDMDLCKELQIGITDGCLLGMKIGDLITDKEIMAYKLDLMVKQIRYENRKAKVNGSR